MTEVEQRITVRVPATSANLGPGFDAFGLALSLSDEMQVELGGSGLTIKVDGEGAGDVPRDARHLVVRAMDATFSRLGMTRPPLTLKAHNSIPHGRGLGSSAAAIVAGGLLARGVAGSLGKSLTDDDLLDIATTIEGHPDNVAACLLGGLTIAWVEGRRVRAVRLDTARGIALVVLVPPVALSTEAARGLLPGSVPHADAAFNAGRAGLLVAALTQRPDLLLAATDDRLHQPYRASAMQETATLVQALRARDIPAVVSGAGPSVLALADEASVDSVVELAPTGWRALAGKVGGGATVS